MKARGQVWMKVCLAWTLVLWSLPALVQAQFTCTTNAGRILITGYTGAGGDVTIPGMIDGLPVSGIGANAFAGISSLTNLTIESGPTRIGNHAFAYCPGLASIAMPDSITDIGDGAFYQCSGLKRIVIPDGVVLVPNHAFQNCTSLTNVTIGSRVAGIGEQAFLFCTSLATVTIPANVISIGDRAFWQCTNLIYVILQAGVTSIGKNAFASCAGLTGMVIPASVTNIGATPFAECHRLTTITVDTNNPAYSSQHGILFDKTQNTLLECPAAKTGDYVIPGSVTRIAWNAFLYSQLNSVIIPQGVTLAWQEPFDYAIEPVPVNSIEGGAFALCPNLTGIYFLGNAPTIDATAFGGDDAIVYHLPETSGWDASFGGLPTQLWIRFGYVVTNGGIMITGYTSSVGVASIPAMIDGLPVVAIADDAFLNCLGLRELTIPAGVTNIGANAFANCPDLTAVYFMGSPPALEPTAFAGNNATIYYLAGVPDWGPSYGGLTVAEWIPFTYTTNQHGTITITGYDGPNGTVAIPASINGLPVTEIGTNALFDKTWLTNVTIPGGVTNIETGAFYRCSGLTDFVFGEDIIRVGDYAFKDCIQLGSVTIPASVTTIGAGAFNQCSGLTNIVIPASVHNIADYLFQGCDRLESLFLSASVTNIGAGAFAKCFSLASITIPDTVSNVGDYAFQECLSLGNIVIPPGVSRIGEGVFNQCWSLTNATIPDSVTSIEIDAFGYCMSLTRFSVPDNVTNIGEYAFEQCLDLEQVTLGSKVVSIGSFAFHSCARLAGITFPNSVTEIGDEAFAYCDNLTNLMIPDGVIAIGDYAFQECNALTNVTIHGNSASIGIDAFYRCSNLATAYIGAGVANIGAYAFEDCTSLANVTLAEGIVGIGEHAFQNCASLTSVVIPGSVSDIGNEPFGGCPNLTEIVVAESNSVYASEAGVLVETTWNRLVQYPAGKSGSSYVIPSGINRIGRGAFGDSRLTAVTIPATVTDIEFRAFHDCLGLNAVYFQGDTPNVQASAFVNDPDATVYYLPGTSGWVAQVQTQDDGLGVGKDGFGFNIDGSPSLLVPVEACTNLAASEWSVVDTVNGSSYFIDYAWMDYPARFYRLGQATVGGRPVALWNPEVQTHDDGFGVVEGQFGFNIAGSSNLVFVVEACTNLGNTDWEPIETNRLTNGQFHFSDPQWTNYSRRYYRLRSP